MSREYEIKLYREGVAGGVEGENEFIVTYGISPGRPTTRIDPEEYPEVELIKVTCDGLPFDSDIHDDWFVEQITDQHIDIAAERAADRADYLYEQRRDQEMMRDFEGDD